jgi:hypothetical protein
VLRGLLIVCAVTTLQLESANAQAQGVTWPGLSGLSSSPIYLEKPLTPLYAPLLTTPPSDTSIQGIQPTHWKEGGVVGAVAVGAFGGLLGAEICQVSDNRSGGCTGATVGGALGGAVLGFFVGALIGGQFPKHSAQETQTTESSGGRE